jgi:acetoacetyl-CoA reductase
MGGIGTSLCQRLHQDGFKVIAGCGPSRDHARWIGEQAELGFTFHCSVGNVGDWDSTVAAFAKVRAEHGPVDVLVNNAGITRDGMFRKMTRADWDAVIETNLTSLFNVTKQVIDDMVERGWGRIINISSVNGEKGQFGQTNYSAAKAGMHGFTMALAQEVASKGVTVNTVSPGYIATDMVERSGRKCSTRSSPASRQAPRHAAGHRVDGVVGRLGGIGVRDRGRLLGQRRPAHGLRRAAAGRHGTCWWTAVHPVEPSHAYLVAAPQQGRQTVPDITFRIRRNDEWATLTTDDLFKRQERRRVLAARRVHARPARPRTCHATTSLRRRS